MKHVSLQLYTPNNTWEVFKYSFFICKTNFLFMSYKTSILATRYSHYMGGFYKEVGCLMIGDSRYLEDCWDLILCFVKVHK